MEPYTVGLYTLGCKVSQYETEAIAEAFEALGFVRHPFDSVCDVYVINTCTVTSESDRKSRQIVRRAIKKNKDAVVMVMGCSVQNEGDVMQKIDGISYLSGTEHKMKLPEVARSLLAEKQSKNCEKRQNPSQDTPKTLPICDISHFETPIFEPMCVKGAPRTRAYVKIEDGCGCRCTYCAIPGARGPVRSKPAKDILEEIKGLAQGGTKEVVLTGIEIASYGQDLGKTRLIDLLEMLDREEWMPRLRLGSLTPEIIDEAFVKRLSSLTKIVPHFHLSVQSGCDTILKKMARRYLTNHVLEGMALLREKIPHVMFTCDMMVGFPSESKELFAETVEFTKQARFVDMHIFIYSKRPGTPAASMPYQVEPMEAKARSQALLTLSQTIKNEIFDEVIEEKWPLSVLFETYEDGYWYGHTENYLPVKYKSEADLHATILTLTPLSHDGHVILAN